jgi:hypothetical protein
MRWIWAATAMLWTLALVAPLPASAQDADEEEQCGVETRRKSSALGNLLGALADQTGVGRSLGRVGNSLINIDVRGFLTDAIACALTAREAAKATASTNTALSQGVGGSSTWKSEERKGVTGTTTVVAETKARSGRTCRTARTIIIVEGEEKSVEQSYCSANGSKWEVATA